ncbi:MAG TPA: DUF1343 domain-containing protein [Chloroflexi bacterium]|nr:DUF1343 domain-containing protein [Chloroflexota bacterium]HHW84771.1 DUF1343 domain-containing protein [Chloroflexota bacterium]
MSLVNTGLQQLITTQRDLLSGRRIGLVTQPAAVTTDLRAAEDALITAGATLTALFGPEHGFDGAAADGAAVDHAVHARLGVPVYSLYGADREPTAAMLAEVDLLIFDMQDVGVRFYTYLSTLYYLLRACGRTGVPLLVLDRPNPINGVSIEGPPVTPGLESFVGIVDIPIRHGMTLGELARLINIEQNFGADLTVLALTGWRRSLWFDQTGLLWAPTSPGMPHLITATVYPGTCFVEGTNLSEGRGTALPFEIVGAPWLDGYRLAISLNALGLPGVRFRPVHFMPSASKHAGLHCQGVQVHVTDRNAMRAVTTGLHVIAACRAQDPERFLFLESSWEGRPPHFDLLAGNATLREGLALGYDVAGLTDAWCAAEAAFRVRRAPYLLYAETG